MKAASHKIPGVRTIKVGHATRIVRADFFEAIGIPDPLPPETRPLVMTPKEAERCGFSRSTVDRMIAQGRAAPSPDNQTAA
jgi:hypothetical protein